MRATGMGRRTVITSIRRLEAKDYIFVERGGGRYSNKFKINWRRGTLDSTGAADGTGAVHSTAEMPSTAPQRCSERQVSNAAGSNSPHAVRRTRNYE